MESCASAIYRLSATTAEAIATEGAAFFLNANSQDAQHHFSDWAETPLPREKRPPWHALSGCGDSQNQMLSDRLEAALQSSGSYYAFTPNKEGMILIVPASKLAAFLYVG